MTSANDEEGSSAGVSARCLDELFDLLAANRRRLALYYLDGCEDDTADFEEVVAFVTARAPKGNDASIALDLRHNHVPRLEQAGVVEYDHRSGTIRYRGGELLEAWIERAAEHDGA